MPVSYTHLGYVGHRGSPAGPPPGADLCARARNGIITDAIRRELRRGGQVYYLHNRVESIERCAAGIQMRIPEARVAFAHGKMTEEQLSEIWRQVMEHEIDVLVCTTCLLYTYRCV